MYEVYADQTGLYRWRFLVKSGDVLANSGNSYSTREAACRALEAFKAALTDPDPTLGCQSDESHLRVVR